MSPAAPKVVPEHIDAPGGPVEVAAGEVLIQLSDDASADEVRSDLEALGVVWIGRGNGSGLWRAAFGPRVETARVAARVAGIPGVARVAPNPLVRGASCGSGDLVDGPQWESDRVGVPAVCPDDSTLPQVVIAVVDSGIAYEDHSDASGSYLLVDELDGVPFVSPYDFVNDDEHANDDNGHGTHLAGLMAARDRLRGYAPNPVLMPVKVLDEDMVGTEWSLLEGIYWAVDNGAEVINLSLTYGLSYVPSSDLFAALAWAEHAGVVVVAAGGNQGLNKFTAYPAAVSSVIAVSATRLESASQVKHPSYSNKGYALDIASAGGDLSHDKNDDGIPDGLIAQTIHPDDPTDVGYWVMAGSSQAAAVVSAQASWLLGLGVDAPLVRTALLVGSGAPKDRAEFDDEFGFGFGSSAEFQAMLDGPGLPQLPGVFVNAVVGLRDEGSRTKAVVHLEVIGEDGEPLNGVRVRGHFRGADDKVVAAKTNGDGEATVRSDAFDLDSDSDPVLIVFSVDMVELDLRDQLEGDYADGLDVTRKFNTFPVVPGGFYRVGEGNAGLMTEALDGSGGGIVFEVNASAGGTVCDLFDCNKLDTTYNSRTLGSGFGSSTVHVAFNHTYFQAIGGSGFGSSTVGVLFDNPLWFPWGSSDSAEYTSYSGSGFGSSTVGVLPWDWSLFGSGFGSSTVGILSYDSTLWGSGFGSSTVGVLSPSGPLWGSGFGSSTVNTLRLSPGLWGSGFGSSTVGLLPWNSKLAGSGFGSSTVGLTWGWTVMGAGEDAVEAAAGEGLGSGAVQTSL